MELIALLFGAGIVAGGMNAVAGGGTFVSLPVLTLAGLAPTVANASSTVALFPGTVASVWAYRRDIQPLPGAATRVLMALTVVGGLIGALLLLFTPERAFVRLIPWLLLTATIALAMGARLGEVLRRLGLRMGLGSLFVAQFFLGVYGGYFGGAVGLMMLAVWTVFTDAGLRTMTPLRTLMVGGANGIAVICFAVSGNVRWRESLVVMAGGVAGGYLGARLGRRLPAPVLRVLILAITIATTAAFFFRAGRS